MFKSIAILLGVVSFSALSTAAENTLAVVLPVKINIDTPPVRMPTHSVPWPVGIGNKLESESMQAIIDGPCTWDKKKKLEAKVSFSGMLNTFAPYSGIPAEDNTIRSVDLKYEHPFVIFKNVKRLPTSRIGISKMSIICKESGSARVRLEWPGIADGKITTAHQTVWEKDIKVEQATAMYSPFINIRQSENNPKQSIVTYKIDNQASALLISSSSGTSTLTDIDGNKRQMLTIGLHDGNVSKVMITGLKNNSTDKNGIVVDDKTTIQVSGTAGVKDIPLDIELVAL